MAEDIVELQVESMAPGGDGLARDAAGRVVFVRGALPGESVAARITESHADYARAVLDEWPRVPSRDRLARPRCPEFGRWPDRGRRPQLYCGACDWQHVAYGAQLRYKADLLRDALRRQGGIAEPPVSAVLDPGAPWRYRNHLGLRTAGGKLAYVAADSNGLVPIGTCPIADPLALELAHDFAIELDAGVEIDIRVGTNTGDALVLLSGADEAIDALEISTDMDVSVVIARDDGRLDVAAGQPYLVERLAGRPFVVPAGSFFQTNTRAAEAIVGRLRSLVPERVATLVDVYSGVGTFAVLMADLAAAVYAVEADADAVAAAVENAAGLDHVTIIQGPADEGLAHVEPEPDVAIVDPPRSGLDRRTAELLASRVRGTIIYVSCDAVTLARDARYLAGAGWTLEECWPIDMFPQACHVESVNQFTRRRGR